MLEMVGDESKAKADQPKNIGIRTIARMDTIPKDTIPNEHNPEWTQSRMDTIPNGQNFEWTPSRMDIIPNEHLHSY